MFVFPRPPAVCRRPQQPQRALIHTLQYAVSFCAKGSIRNHNRCFGEDSAVAETLITPGKLQGFSFLSVADGVGGWRRHGIDSSYLSQGLTREMAALFARSEQRARGDAADVSAELPSTQTLLRTAFARLFRRGPIYAGGTTVCLGLFDPRSAQLEVLNLGDSGALVCRGGAIVEQTVPAVSGFVPRQLTVLPKGMRARDFAVDLDPSVQTRCDAVRWQLQKHDFVLFATDGFFDNVPLAQILHTLDSVQEEAQHKHTSETPAGVQEIADKLLRLAYYNSLDPNFASPFALRLAQADYQYSGGKPDDISLVCGFVGETAMASGE